MRNIIHAAGAGIGAGLLAAARGMVVVLLTALLSGCAYYQARMLDRQRAEDEQACKDAGFRPSTNEFAKCLQDHDLTRIRAASTKSGN
jgi:hypothetical protein